MGTKTNHVIGGGTFFHVRTHLSLATPAFGQTAIKLHEILQARGAPSTLHLTKMADPRNSQVVTNDDLARLTQTLVEDPTTGIIFFNAAPIEEGQIGDVPSGKYAERLQSRQIGEGDVQIAIKPAKKILKSIREQRKDILLVAFKATAGDPQDLQYAKALQMMKESHVNLVLANDTVTRTNMIVVPEEARYHITTDRQEALEALVDMALLRSGLHYTRSTVIDAPRIAWNSTDISPALRTVVDYCIEHGAYKPFLGKTAGHFASRGPQPGTFYTSRRSSDFNRLATEGMLFVKTAGNNRVISYGGRPSVGGQSQRIIFDNYPDLDHIVHFHCPMKPGAEINVRKQRAYECGSHECGQNTSDGLTRIEDGIFAVYLENHGPNIVFRGDVDPRVVIDVIEDNFDLTDKTGGLILPEFAYTR